MKRSPSLIAKRSVVIAGHKTSISLEQAFWDALVDIAKARGMLITTLVTEIEQERAHNNLSSAIRLYVLDFYSARSRR